MIINLSKQGFDASLMYGEMKKHGITHILVVAASAEMRYPEVRTQHDATPPQSTTTLIFASSAQDFIYKRLPVYDSKQEDLLSHFESSVAFINEGRTRGAVLVHWYAMASLIQPPSAEPDHTHTHTPHTHNTHNSQTAWRAYRDRRQSSQVQHATVSV
jgi:hypothetical protein